MSKTDCQFHVMKNHNPVIEIILAWRNEAMHIVLIIKNMEHYPDFR